MQDTQQRPKSKGRYSPSRAYFDERIFNPKKERAVGLLAFFLCFILLGVFTPSCTGGRDQAQAEKTKAESGVLDVKETTIRNVTDQTVHYTIRPIFSDSGPMEKALVPGAVDWFLFATEVDVTFQRGDEAITYRLGNGKPYSYRLDESDELELYDGSHGRSDAPDLAPFVPTPMAVVEKMLELAEVDPEDIVYDLGCGDGRIVIAAAKKYGARGVGVDLDPQRIEESNTAAKEAGVEGLVEFRFQDAMKVDLSSATVVTIYLLPESNEILRPMLEKQLKPGAMVVSHNYSIPGWKDREVDYSSVMDDGGEEHSIYVYRK